MSSWFSLDRHSQSVPATRRRVFVTGAAGRIGSYFAEHAHERYDLRLMIRPARDASTIARFGEVVRADLRELPLLKELFTGADTILHLAAIPRADASWEELLINNIEGTYNVFVAAVAARCRRVVFASSIHAVSGYGAGIQVHPDDPVNPGDLYGVSKCFGEALARHMSSQHQLSTICVRIGSFQPLENARSEKSLGIMNTFVSHRDLQQLLEKCIDNIDLRFAIVHGASDNHFNTLDISGTGELLDYKPADSFLEENMELARLHLRSRARPHNESETGKSGDRFDIGRV